MADDVKTGKVVARRPAQQVEPHREVQREYVLHIVREDQAEAKPPEEDETKKRPIKFNRQMKQQPKGGTLFANHRIIVGAWLVAMALIALDEWKRYQILPRPSRLWWASATYGLLMLMGTIEALAPLANAMAIGYTIVLGIQYFSQGGQFA